MWRWLGRCPQNGLLAPIQMSIGRKSRQPGVFYRTADRKVIQTLKLIALQAEEVMERIVEIAPDSGTPKTGGFSLQIQHMAEHTGLPEKPSIPPRTLRTNAFFELCNHPEAECARSSNFLVATYTLGLRSEIAINKFEERQVLRTPGRAFKEKSRT